ncbi:hypothetical protein FAGKG844_440035 [Frankia sp. AgKG'84/4]
MACGTSVPAPGASAAAVAVPTLVDHRKHAHVADPTSGGAPGRAPEWEGRGRRIARNPANVSMQARTLRSGRDGGAPVADGVSGRI